MTKRIFEERGFSVPPELEQTLTFLDGHKLPKEQQFYTRDSDEIAYFLAIRPKRTPDERKWNLRLGMPYEEFQGQFKVHVGDQ